MQGYSLKKVVLITVLIGLGGGALSVFPPAQRSFAKAAGWIGAQLSVTANVGACPFLKFASDRGDLTSTYKLGVAHHSGACGARNLDEAFALFSNAAERGYAPAQRDLGKMLLIGDASDMDVPRALHWFRKGAEAGDAISQGLLGSRMMNSRDTNTAAEGVEWLEKAAAQNNRVGSLRLAELYLRGRGDIKIKEDLRRSIAHSEPWAKKGEVGASFIYGTALALGLRSGDSALEAYVWMKFDVEQMIELGLPTRDNEIDKCLQPSVTS